MKPFVKISSVLFLCLYTLILCHSMIPHAHCEELINTPGVVSLVQSHQGFHIHFQHEQVDQHSHQHGKHQSGNHHHSTHQRAKQPASNQTHSAHQKTKQAASDHHHNSHQPEHQHDSENNSQDLLGFILDFLGGLAHGNVAENHISPNLVDAFNLQIAQIGIFPLIGIEVERVIPEIPNVVSIQEFGIPPPRRYDKHDPGTTSQRGPPTSLS